MPLDLYDHDLHNDPFPTYRTLRASEPVHHTSVHDAWVLSRFEDVLDALHDHRSFSSADGVGVEGGGDELLLPMMLTSDPPRHDLLRAVVSRRFTPRAVAGMEPSVRALASRLIDEMASADDSPDLVASFTAPLPAMVIADLLGIPPADHAWYCEKVDAIAQRNPRDEVDPEPVRSKLAELYAYLEGVIADRRERPGDDLVSTVTTADVDGRRLDPIDLLGFCFMLLAAGIETTRNLLADALVVLAVRPVLCERLVSSPGLVPAAVEEVLRFDSPVQVIGRTATRDVSLHGVTIPAGAHVLLLIGSANRDEREFSAPDVYDIDRSPGRHVAFGHGLHHCLGAALARLETRIGLEEFLRRVARWEPIENPVARIHSGMIRGVERLPARVEFR